MSYCRLSDGDVYAYDSVEGGVRFYVSHKKGEHFDRLCRTYNDAYQYIKSLRDEHGLDVPDYAIEALRADAIEEARTITGPNGVVAELIDDIAKLRELVHGLDHCTTWANEDGKDCWSCPLWHDKDCTAEDIERELGIEDDT